MKRHLGKGDDFKWSGNPVNLFGSPVVINPNLPNVKVQALTPEGEWATYATRRAEMERRGIPLYLPPLSDGREATERSLRTQLAEHCYEVVEFRWDENDPEAVRVEVRKFEENDE